MKLFLNYSRCDFQWSEMTPVESITRSVEAYLWRLFLQLTLNYKNSIHYKVVADRPMLDFFRFIQDNLIYYNSGFSIEGGTRRLISCYFRIYSCLLCVAFLFFVLFFICFQFTLPFLARLWSKQNQDTWLPFWTRSMNAILLDSRPSWWNMVTSSYVPKWRPSVPTLGRHSVWITTTDSRNRRISRNCKFFGYVKYLARERGKLSKEVADKAQWHLYSPVCNKLIESAVVLRNKKENRRKLPPKVPVETEAFVAVLYSVDSACQTEACKTVTTLEYSFLDQHPLTVEQSISDEIDVVF